MWFMAESTIKVVGGARHSLYVIACYRVQGESSQFDIMSLTLTKKENIVLLFIYINILMTKITLFVGVLHRMSSETNRLNPGDGHGIVFIKNYLIPAR